MLKKMLALALLGFLASPAFAGGYVHGYTRSNGTYVHGYYRSSPNGTVTDNYSFKGNTNPYTGSTGTNRYIHSPSSPYYEGGSTGTQSGYGSSYGNQSTFGTQPSYGSGMNSGYGSQQKHSGSGWNWQQ